MTSWDKPEKFLAILSYFLVSSTTNRSECWENYHTQLTAFQLCLERLKYFSFELQTSKSIPCTSNNCIYYLRVTSITCHVLYLKLLELYSKLRETIKVPIFCSKLCIQKATRIENCGLTKTKANIFSILYYWTKMQGLHPKKCNYLYFQIASLHFLVRGTQMSLIVKTFFVLLATRSH